MADRIASLDAGSISHSDGIAADAIAVAGRRLNEMGTE